MNIIKTVIPDVKIIQPQVYGDERGFFVESFSAQKYAEALGVDENAFLQDNISRSDKGVLRGLHFQNAPHAQGKLVSVLSGRVFDVVVDIRPESLTYGQHVSITLTPPTHDDETGQWSWQQFWVPPGFAHGFLALEDNTLFTYKCAHSYYAPEHDAGILYSDPALRINWPLKKYNIDTLIVSDKDKEQLSLNKFKR